MNDQQIMEYLRSRAQVTPPLDFSRSVMGAVEAAPPSRSTFGRFFPAFAAIGVAAILVALALILDPTRDVGPAPSASVPPSFAADEAGLAELEAAVTGAIDALSASGGVQGTHLFTIEHYLASATWFDWRPNGDQVIVERQDVDVSAPWWTDPDGRPLSVGERVETTVSVITEGSYFFSRDDGWTAALDEERPPLTYGVGMLTGDMPAVAGLPPNADVTISHDDLQDGGEVWVLSFERDGGSARVEWRIDAEGRLVLYAVQGAGLAMTPGVDLGNASTRAVIEFTPLEDPAPIMAPNLSAAPDPAFFGLPEDFPMATPAPEPAGAVQVAECADPTGTFQVTLPEGWWTNETVQHPALGELAACRFFAPEQFDPLATTPDNVIPGGVSLTIDYLQDCIGSFNTVLEEREVEVDGWRGTATEFAQGEGESEAPGTYEYQISLAPEAPCETGAAFIVGRTSVAMAGDYEANKLILDEVMASMRITVDGTP